MRFEPKTQKQIDEESLLPAGIFHFLVGSAEDRQSKAGNDMAELKLKIEDESGRTFTVIDYLVATDGMAYKLRHFAETTGLLAEYEKGQMDAEIMEGRTGQCKIAVEPAKGTYRAKNIVTDYVIGADARTAAPAAPKTPDLVDDEIPF